MKRRFRALALPAVAVCVFLCTGCGPTNEEGLKGESKVVPPAPGTPEITDYAGAAKYMQEQQAAKNKAANAKGAAKGEAAPSKEKSK
jgi:hypothetical protein